MSPVGAAEARYTAWNAGLLLNSPGYRARAWRNRAWQARATQARTSELNNNKVAFRCGPVSLARFRPPARANWERPGICSMNAAKL